MFQVADIRYELDARKLNSKGMKAQLLARLTKAVKAEKEQEQEQEENEAEAEDCDEEAEHEEVRSSGLN